MQTRYFVSVMTSLVLVFAAMKLSARVERGIAADYPKIAKVKMDEAVKVAIEKVPGEVLSANLEKEDGVLVYEVEIFDKSGVRHEVLVDAESGKIAKVEVRRGSVRSEDEDED